MVCSSSFHSLKKDSVELKKLQRRASEMIKQLPCEERQEKLKLQFAKGKTEEWYGQDLQKPWRVE